MCDASAMLDVDVCDISTEALEDGEWVPGFSRPSKGLPHDRPCTRFAAWHVNNLLV